MEPLYYTLLVKSKYVLKRLNTSTIQCKSSSDRKVENAKAISVAQCQVGKETKTTNELFFTVNRTSIHKNVAALGFHFCRAAAVIRAKTPAVQIKNLI